MSEYDYQYSESHDVIYCYANSRVLKNKFDIRDASKLAQVERDITGLKIVMLQQNPIKGVFDIKHLQKIHKYIFEDIYSWAGKLREGEFLVKDDTIFCRGSFINQFAADIHSKLKGEHYLKGLSIEIFAERMAYYMGEINALHPFREGNGRTSRVYFAMLASKAGYDLDFSVLDKEALLDADIFAFERDYVPLIRLLKNAISHKNP